MADVVMVCVRQDIERAEALADMFDDFGFSVSDGADDETLRWCGAGVVVWTDAAKASAELAAAVAKILATGKGVVLNFTEAPAPDGAKLSFDLAAWNGDPDDVSLDRVFFALDRMVIAARAMRPAGAIALKSPLRAETPALPAPRAAPAPALRLMVLSLVVIGAVMATGIAIGGNRTPSSAVVNAPVEQIARVTLGEVAPIGVTYDLASGSVEDAPVGRRGFEPPSAPR